MKKDKHTKETVILSIFISILIISAVLSIVFANKISANMMSAISGSIGVLATTVLGVIALWQNKRYKDLSDEKDAQIEQLTLTPECRLLSAKQTPSDNNYQIASSDKFAARKFYYLNFASLNLPMVDITVHKIVYYDKNKNDTRVELKHNQILFNYPKFSVLQSCSGFGIQICAPDLFCLCDTVCEITLQYRNIYDTVYEKTFCFERKANQLNAKIILQERAKKSEEIQNGQNEI